MATKNVKYPGNLGKRPTIGELNVADAAALLDMRYSTMSAARIAGREWEQDRIANLLTDLLDHYKIPLDNNRWFSLALRLARKHVPAFQDAAYVGRPKKLKPFRNLADLANQYANPPIKRKPGRPKRWTDEIRRQIVDDVNRTCEKEGLKGRGRVKRALEILLKRAPLSRRQYWLKRLQKIYSDAQKQIPEMA